MTYIVVNRTNNIELTYENVTNVVVGAGLFMLCFENGETATFHFVDEDGNEWDFYRKTWMMPYMLTFKGAFNGYAEYFNSKNAALEYVASGKFLFTPDALYRYDEDTYEYRKVGSFTKAL